jgi:hypothetical protein
MNSSLEDNYNNYFTTENNDVNKHKKETNRCKLCFTCNLYNMYGYDDPCDNPIKIKNKTQINSTYFDDWFESIELLEKPNPTEVIKKEKTLVDSDEEVILNICKKSKYIQDNFEYLNFTNGFYNFKRLNECLCPICNRVHSSFGLYVFVTKTGKVKYGCYRDQKKPKTTILIGDLNPNAKPINDLPLDDDGNLINIDDIAKIKWSDIYHQKHMKKIIFGLHTTLMMKGYLGVGKTFSIIEFIRENPHLKRILVISPRKSFAINMTGEYKMDFHNYLDLNRKRKKYSSVDRLFVQVESLLKLDDINFEAFDLVILDEVESILQQFVSETMKQKLDDNVKMFDKVVSTAKYVIATDAFMSNKSISCIEQLRGVNNIRYEWNTYIENKRTAYEHQSFQKLNAKAKEMLKEGKKIFYVMSSKEKADKFHNEILKTIPNIRVGIYTRSEGDKSKLKDVQNEWIKYDLIIITSTITVGVNFSVPDYFDSVFIYCSAFGPLIRDMFQSHMRVRLLKSNEMHYCIWDRCNYNYGPFQNSLTKMEQYINQRSSLGRGLENRIHELNIQTIEFKDPPQWYTRNLIYCRFEENLTYHYPKKIFEQYLNICGYTAKKIFDQKKYDKLEEVENKKYKDIKDITYEEYNEIKRKRDNDLMTADEYLMSQKYKFRYFYMKDECGINFLEAFYDRIYSDKKMREIFHSLFIEKNKSVDELHNITVNDFHYDSMYKVKPIKLEWIRKLNDLLGITHSTQIKEFTREKLTNIGTIILPLKKQILEDIEVIDKSKQIKSEIIQIANLINHVYTGWSGAELKAGKRKRVDGIEMGNFIMSFNVQDKGLDISRFIRSKYGEELISKEEQEKALDILSPDRVVPIFNITSPITPVFNITSPVTPVFNITSPITPVFNITSPVTPVFNIISPISPIIPVFNVCV